MSISFDLEAVRRGAPIEYQESYGWVEIKFIGDWSDEHVVCAVPWSYTPEIVLISKLRMAKKKEVVRYMVALMRERSYGNPYTITAGSDDDIKFHEEDENFVEWITDWQEYEIGANDE